MTYRQSSGASGVEEVLADGGGLGGLALLSSGPKNKSARLLQSLARGGPQVEARAWFEDDLVARFVLDLQGHVVSANRRGRELALSGLVGAGGLFMCSTHRSRPELDQLLARMAQGRQSDGRILFRAGDDDWCVLKLLITPGAPERVFAAVCPIKPIPADRIEMLRGVFGLTRSETAVLVHLTAGEAPKEIGRQLDMSVHTVRAHLRSLCMRMGVKGINGALRLSFQLSG
jgi:DNA-binding CsgD family transcriptional regulator